MIVYGHLLYVLTILGILIIAKTALKWVRIADILRRLCVEYLTINWVHKGLRPSQEEVEAEIDARIEEIKESE